MSGSVCMGELGCKATTSTQSHLATDAANGDSIQQTRTVGMSQSVAEKLVVAGLSVVAWNRSFRYTRFPRQKRRETQLTRDFSTVIYLMYV